jgi:hypothetical protein
MKTSLFLTLSFIATFSAFHSSSAVKFDIADGDATGLKAAINTAPGAMPAEVAKPNVKPSR